ncbi:MAG: UvrB/UvrC motif-containing protein [Oscillospiraceae bacterium]|nr:UvrB/UvrC motif-containing protein [Oscillospiraceae bacterium]
MKCEHCGVENATFFCKTTVNGRSSEMHLCHACAEKLGLNRTVHQAFSRPFGRLFDPFSLLGDFGVATPTLLTEFPAPNEETAPAAEELVDAIDAKKLQEERRKNALQTQLRRAIDEERYEDAARLRDELRTLN